MRTDTATAAAFLIYGNICMVQDYLVNVRDFLRCKETAAMLGLCGKGPTAQVSSTSKV